MEHYWNQGLDSSNVPSTSDFTVTTAGSSNSVSAVSISGREVTLTVGTTIKNDEAVTVAYSDPTSGDDTNAIQDSSGNDVTDLSSTSVTNNSELRIISNRSAA